MSHETTALEQALQMARQLPLSEQLRLTTLQSDRLCLEWDREESVDMLTLAGLGAELWQRVYVAAYLEEERSSWDRRTGT
jgi:hypothetical protein